MEMKNHKKILTEDGSYTFYSDLYQEACHSEAGASTETIEHYIKGCKLQSRTDSPLNILEVGFGTGIGFLETKKAMNSHFFCFYSFEISLELIKNFEQEQSIEFINENQNYIYQTKDYKLVIIHGDARETINTINDIKFHAIYQDAFSPKKNSILWTVEWFEALKNISHPSVIMSTYSASSSIRKSMLSAGWTLYEGNHFGKKRSSTRAKLSGKTSFEILDKLRRSPVPAITDKNHIDYSLEKL